MVRKIRLDEMAVGMDGWVDGYIKHGMVDCRLCFVDERGFES